MSQAPITLTVRPINSATSSIDIQGDLSANAENALMEAYAQASYATTRVILLNFTGLTYMNSSGIGLLVKLLIQSNRQHQQLLCYGLSEHYQHIFTLTRLNEVLKIYATENEALTAL